MIIHEGPRKWTLYTKDGGRTLGTHKTKREALAQEHAIQVNKRKRKTR